MFRSATRKTLSLLEACAIHTDQYGEVKTLWSRLGTGRSFSAAACKQHRTLRGHTKPLAALSQPCRDALVYQQCRAFSWAFWRRSEAPASETIVPEESLVDVELVDSIVELAGPVSMDAATWATIYNETNLPNIWVAESLLASTHDTLGLSWMAALPITVVVMRTAMAPMHIIAMREGHKMAKANPLIQDAQKAMMLSMERGASVQDAQNQYVKEVKDIMDSHKTGFMSSIYPMFVQLPVFTGYYFALTMMCNHHLPSLVVDSAPFGFDLTTSDPFHLAPFACSGTIMLAMYLSMSHKWKMLPPDQQQMAKYGAFIAPPLLTAAFWTFPSALCYYWTCSNVYTIGLELVLRHAGLRALVGLPSIAEQAELMLDAQKRRATGGQVGMFDMYSRTAEAVNKQQPPSFMNAFKQDAANTPPQVTVTPAKPAEAPSRPAPLVTSAAARFRKKGRG